MINRLNNLLNSNPLVNYAVNQTAQYSHRRIAYISFCGGLVTLAIGYALLMSDTFQVLYGIWILAWIIYLSIPIIVAASAALITANDIEGGSFQLLYMTALSDEAIIVGYIAMVLQRLRGLIAILIVLMPIFVISMFYMLIRYDYQVSNISGYIISQPPQRGEIILPTFGFLILLIALWTSNILAAGVGVVNAIRYRQPSVASSISVSLMAVSIVLMTIGAWVAFLIPQVMQISMTLCSPAAFFLFFTLLWESMMRSGNQFVRKPSLD